MKRRKWFRLLPKLVMPLVVCVALLLAMMKEGPTHAQEPSRHDIIVLLDNSGSMALKYDKKNKRTRFATFLVRYLQAFEPEHTGVGVARFAAIVDDPENGSLRNEDGVTPLVPLQPVDDWLQGEFKKLSTEEMACPDRRRANRDPCYGTRHVDALNWAEEQLATCTKTANSRCDILIFTDGQLDEPNSNSSDEVYDKLEELPEEIGVFLILFDGQGSMNFEHSRWMDWHEREEELIDDFFFNAAEAEPEVVYEESLKLLGLEDSFHSLQKIDLSHQRMHWISRYFPPNTTLVELDLIADSDITEHYTLKPNQESGTYRSWNRLTVSRLGVRLRGQGVAFYRVTNHTVPLEFDSLTLLPEETQIVGKAIQVKVRIDTEGRPLNDRDQIRVCIQIQKTYHKTALTCKKSGTNRFIWELKKQEKENTFAGEFYIQQPGKYKATVIVEPKGWAKAIRSDPPLSLNVQDVQRDVRMSLLRPMWLEEERLVFHISALEDQEATTLPANTEVMLRLEPGEKEYPLEQLDSATWQTTEPLAETGAFTATLLVKGWAESTPQNLTIYPRPELSIESEVTEAAVGESFYVTVSISSTLELTPTLQDMIQQKEVELSPVPNSANHFRGQVTMVDKKGLLLQAEVTFPWKDPEQSDAFMVHSKSPSPFWTPEWILLSVTVLLVSFLFIL